MPAQQSPESTGGIQAVARAAEILNLLTLGDRSTNVAEASKALGIERTTMHRYLSTLERVGLIDRVEDGERRGRFVLGPLARQICTAVLADNTVVDIAASRLQTLADQTRTTAVICFWGRGHASVAHLAYPDNEPLTIRVQVGDQLGLYSAHTHLFLAFRSDQDRMAALVHGAPRAVRSTLQDEVDRARTDHFAEQTFTHGVRVIAVPVFDRDEIVATFGLVSTPAVLPQENGSVQAQLLQRAALDVGELLRNRPRIASTGSNPVPESPRRVRTKEAARSTGGSSTGERRVSTSGQA